MIRPPLCFFTVAALQGRGSVFGQMGGEFRQNGLKGKSTKTSTEHTSKSNPPEFCTRSAEGRTQGVGGGVGGRGWGCGGLEEPRSGFFYCGHNAETQGRSTLQPVGNGAP